MAPELASNLALINPPDWCKAVASPLSRRHEGGCFLSHSSTWSDVGGFRAQGEKA